MLRVCGGYGVVERIIWREFERWRQGESVWRVEVGSIQVVVGVILEMRYASRMDSAAMAALSI